MGDCLILLLQLNVSCVLSADYTSYAVRKITFKEDRTLFPQHPIVGLLYYGQLKI